MKSITTRSILLAIGSIFALSTAMSGMAKMLSISPGAASMIALVVFLLLAVLPQKHRSGYVAGVQTQWGQGDLFKRARQTICNAYFAQDPRSKSSNADEVKAALSDAQQAAANAILTQSELRLEQPLLANKTVFEFPILANAASAITIRPTEVRLEQQDGFFCNAIGIYLALATSSTDSSFELQTYPSPAVFALGGALPAPLNAFYNGQMSVSINKETVLPNYPVYSFRQQPQTQQNAGGTIVNQFDPAQVAIWEPSINFIGTKGYKVLITLPAPIPGAGLDDNTYIVIKLFGALGQNITLMS